MTPGTPHFGSHAASTSPPTLITVSLSLVDWQRLAYPELRAPLARLSRGFVARARAR
jgi:hypothetical protein